VPNFGQNIWHGLDDDFSTARVTKGPPAEGGDLAVTNNLFSDTSASFLPGRPTHLDLSVLHPSAPVAFKLWDTFLQNVNPLCKVIHAQSGQQLVLEACQDFGSLAKPSVALMFAIYAIAVVSLEEEDCLASLHESRDVLLFRYLSATRQALDAAGLMKTRSLSLLQAYTLYLVGDYAKYTL
jgi:hypothetical protein